MFRICLGAPTGGRRRSATMKKLLDADPARLESIWRGPYVDARLDKGSRPNDRLVRKALGRVADTAGWRCVDRRLRPHHREARCAGALRPGAPGNAARAAARLDRRCLWERRWRDALLWPSSVRPRHAIGTLAALFQYP